MRGVVRKMKKKKTTEIIKQELLVSILEVSDKEENYLHMNEEVKNVKELKDSISLVKKYEDLLKGVTRKDYQHSRKTGRVTKKTQKQ